ncbi:3-carboxy-cis,cis-muconate cycloisomerase [Pelagibacterium lacus]|uniref:3-carboxy-cis,cis-muconate cycloisomerase n=1 Tax=Pelagibacterium lacus TaxID=2282655 RepID=A0A369W5V4_9HYPH|nr:3-carboxy-cis,cis-muconate cycloisomerase [Pelagibacterium lacus]RDE09723.1 3-carboxy-cis,cis-muconate cycloisomerase [Pelagibacterium lacus]
MGLSAFDHPILSGLFGDPELAGLLAVEADIAAMVRFEIALAAAQAECGVIPQDAAATIAARLDGFAPDIARLRDGVARDGVVVPELVRQLKAGLDPDSASHLHFDATSQDVIDTSLVLRLREAALILDRRIEALDAAIGEIAARWGAHRLMGRTRMQDALEIRVADRLAAWRMPLRRHRTRLAEMTGRVFVVQYGGAVGTLAKVGPEAPAVTAGLARRLGLDAPDRNWHSQRDRLVEFADWLALVAGSLGKMGQDVALMAQAGGDEIRLSGGGGSSAMPHKQNPVGAEVLVSLARFAAGASGTMAQALVHEQERSGAAWTLEWLVLPQLVLATGSALLLGQRLAESIEGIGQA